MRSLFLFLMPLFLVSLIPGARASKPQRYLMKIRMSDYKSHLEEIRQAGLDIAGINLKKGTADLIVDQDEVQTLRKIGVQIPRNPTELRLESPDPKYKTPAEVDQILHSYQKNYPDLALVESIGKSVQGRDIWAIEITQHVAQGTSGKRSVLFNGMHHAREVMATEVPLDIVDYLLTNYGKDEKVTHWVNSNVIYVIPMLNVDGNNIVWTQDNMWRKNSRGVDINRNYPYRWDDCGGSSGFPFAQDYRGPSAASEPETQALMSFVNQIQPVFDISFHSYSELVIYPYGCGEHTETASVIEPLGKEMASLIPSDDGRGTYTAGLAPELLYPVDGDDISWMYHQDHVIPFVIELNSDSQGFQPSYDEWRDKTVNKLRPGWQLLLDRMDQAQAYQTLEFSL